MPRPDTPSRGDRLASNEAPERPLDTFRPCFLANGSETQEPQAPTSSSGEYPEWKALRDCLEDSLEQKFRRQEDVILRCLDRLSAGGGLGAGAPCNDQAAASRPPAWTGAWGGNEAWNNILGGTSLLQALPPSSAREAPASTLSEQEVRIRQVEASVRHIEEMLMDKLVVTAEPQAELNLMRLTAESAEAHEQVAVSESLSDLDQEGSHGGRSTKRPPLQDHKRLPRAGSGSGSTTEPPALRSPALPISPGRNESVSSRSLGSRLASARRAGPNSRSALAQKQRWQIVMEDRFQRLSSRAQTASLLESHSTVVVRWLEWFMFLEEPPRNGIIAKIILNKRFEAVCAAVIIFNAIFAAYTTNYEIANPREELLPALRMVEYSFLSFYVVELLLKIFVHRFFFFANEDMRWNIFDLVLVLLSVYYQCTAFLMQAKGNFDLTYMRTLRIMKLARILRVIRVAKVFTELRLMLNSIIGSFISLFWSFTMLLFVFYIFGLIFVQGAASYVAMHEEELDSTSKDKIKGALGSVQLAMLSLYKATTGGTDWENIFDDPIERMGWLNCALFIFLIAFYQVALLNILTGVFVENALKLATPDRESLALELRKRELMEGAELREICDSMDPHGTGSITLPELQRAVRNAKTKASLQVLGLHIKNAEMFFEMLTGGNDESLGIEEFVLGCMRLKGSATSIDLHSLSYTIGVHRLQVSELFEALEERLDRLINCIEELLPRSRFVRPSAAKCLPKETRGGQRPMSNHSEHESL